jgi:hypothetical protein
MPAINWGLLAKSLVDDETIEEAITRLILAHEQDEASHLGAGESLQSHKAAVIIDHLAASVIYDKVAEFSIDTKKLVSDQYMLMTCFESIDGWNAIDYDPGGGVNITLFGTHVGTGAVINDFCVLAAEPNADDPVINFSKPIFFQTSVKVKYSTAQLIYIIVGDFDANSFGFIINNNNLQAWHSTSGSSYVTALTGINIQEYNIYRAVFDPVAGNIKFYVNGILKHTRTTNLPTGYSTFVFQYYVKTNATAQKSLWARDLFFAQGR